MKEPIASGNSPWNRRRFLGGLGGATGLLILPSRTAFAFRANERLNLALIGDMYVFGHFSSAIHVYPGVEIVAICNPDQRKVPDVFKLWQQRAQDWPNSLDAGERGAAEPYTRLAERKPRVFSDFRRMLDEMGGGIDAVVVSTFDHLHAVACGAAMRAGKHVFCERPLGLTAQESRALRGLAAEEKVATSIRNPGNASGPFRRAVELIRQGAIGPVEEVHVWFDRGGPDHEQPPQGAPAVPDGLDWDLWLGPAAMRPYHPQWMAYAQWRDFSNGGIGTFGPHAANLAFMALDVGELWQRRPPGASRPILRVQADCPRINRLSFPRWEIIRWRIPAREGLPPVTFTWHHGPGLAPGARELLLGKMGDLGASAAEQETLLGYAGALIIGSKGTIATDDHNVKFTMLPGEKFQTVEQETPKSISPSRGHYVDWLIACRGGEPAWANFDYAAPLSEFLMLGNLATQFEDALEYDPASGRILNHPEANQALSYDYRQGWGI